MDLALIILGAAGLLGLYMAWNIGANDVANAMGTSVGSGALTLGSAVIVAGIFEFAGAVLVGGSVTKTIAKGIVDVTMFSDQAMVYAVGMTCCLLAAAVWLNIATVKGWPVSTTHSIVGAVIGFGIAAGGVSVVHWWKVAAIVASWFVSPLLGGLVGYFCFVFVLKRILSRGNPLSAMRKWGPFLLFPIFALLALSLMVKGLKLDIAFPVALLLSAGIGLGASLIATPLLRRASVGHEDLSPEEAMRRTERIFLVLQIMTACFVAFAHGSNDVANAVGPLAAVFAALDGDIMAQVAVPIHVLLVGAVGIILGLATYGYKVIQTIGSGITELTPSRGFSAEFAAAATILVGSKLGLPVSTTHTLVGAVIGVGFARGVGALNKGILGGIFTSWFVTVPFTGILSVVLFVIARAALGI